MMKLWARKGSILKQNWCRLLLFGWGKCQRTTANIWTSWEWRSRSSALWTIPGFCIFLKPMKTSRTLLNCWRVSYLHCDTRHLRILFPCLWKGSNGASNWQHLSEAFAPAINPRFVRCLCNSGLLTLSILWQKGLSHRAHLSQLVESGAIWHLIALNFFLRPIGIPTLRFPHVVWNPPREGHLYRHGAMHRRRSSAVHGKDARRCKHRNSLCPVSRGICQYPRATICHLPRSHGKDIWQGNVIFARHTAEQILRALIYCLVARSYPKSQTNKGERSVKQSWKLDQSVT